MAIDIEDLKEVYNALLDEGLERIKGIYEETNMADEFYATAASNVISRAMGESSKTIQTIKGLDLLNAQIVTEQNKALDISSTTASRDAQTAQDIINKAAQKTLIDNQVLKIIKDTAFVEQQTIELVRSVDFNNKIKALDSYADMIGTMGAGGLVISSGMWTVFFDMIKDLNDAISSATVTATVSKAT